MYKQMVSVIKPMLDILAKADSDFAKDYTKKGKTVEEFCKLFYDACSNGRNGGNAVFGSDDLLLGLARHYFHEDDVKDLDVSGIVIVKSTPMASAPATPKPGKTTKKASKPKPKQDEFDFDFDEPTAPVAVEPAEPVANSDDDDWDF